MPRPGPFHFSHSVDYIYEFCPLPNPDFGPSIFVCNVEHTSFHFGLCGRKFVLCLFGQCPGLCTICHSWHHTGVVHLSFQADGKVVFEDIPVFGVCRPACHDSSLYLFVLVLFLEAVVLSQVHVAWDIFYQHIVIGAGTIFQQGGQAWCVTQPFPAGVWRRCKPPGGVRGRAPEANAFWQQSLEN